ncbi:MAG: hypothetical protein HQ522_15080 [Bacteroidetes bacterium]|nr:hypothetical protein [Bacteroidota bacterium]
MSTNGPAPTLNDSLPTACSNGLLTVMKSKGGLNEVCFVTAEIAKELWPAEMEGKSLQQINDDLIDPLKVKFNENISKLREEMKRTGVIADRLKMTGIDFPNNSNDPSEPRAFTIKMEDGSSYYRIPITAVNYEGRWYLMEILMTRGVFSDD